VNGGAVDFLFSLERFGMKFGLTTMARLCDELGHPERAFTSVHIAGTNGKGSVAAMVERALRAGGHDAARYSSPHLTRVEERFVIDGRNVATETLEAHAAGLIAIVDRLVEDGELDGWPTFFECTTALAFDLFRAARVEVAAIEVGLGGRLDATNVITPAVSAIVSIDFDHQAQLGTTLESIAAEKAGIIKPGVPVVCGPLPPEAAHVVGEIAAERHAPVIDAAADPSLFERLAHMPLALRGRHQVANAAVAVRILEALDASGLRVGAAEIAEGLTHAEWPGRLEEFTLGSTRIVLDAAHNPAGARALAEYLRETEPGGVTLVFGVMKDKAVDEMLAILAPLARRTICTAASSSRAMPAAELAAVARRTHRDVRVSEDPGGALEEAVRTRETVVAAGSIFLIGPLRERLLRGILR
jgi:dihydrofolate synthase/folylpolyglutamate synthase